MCEGEKGERDEQGVERLNRWQRKYPHSSPAICNHVALDLSIDCYKHFVIKLCFSLIPLIEGRE